LVWGGGGEAIITTIVNFADKLKKAHPQVELVVQPGAAHDDPIIEKMLGYREKHEGTKVIEAWIGARI
jgi:acetyl esterase/lipase